MARPTTVPLTRVHGEPITARAICTARLIGLIEPGWHTSLAGVGRSVTRRLLPATRYAGSLSLGREVGLPERRLLGDEHQRKIVDRTIAVLGDDEICLAPVDLSVVHPFAVEKQDHVGILLDRTAVAEVAELRPLVL